MSQSPNNPFHAVTVADHELTRQQRQTLIFYQTLQHRTPSAIQMLGKQLPEMFVMAAAMLIPFAIMIGICVAFIPGDGARAPALMLGGIYLGLVLGYLMKIQVTARQFASLWPLLRSIISWTKVDHLLDGSPALRDAEPAEPEVAQAEVVETDSLQAEVLDE